MPVLRPPPLSSEAKDLLALWESKRADGRMPALTDFCAEDLARWTPCLVVLRAGDGRGTFLFERIGDGIAGYFGRDVSERRLADIVDPRSLWAYGRILQEMSRKERPAHFVGPFVRSAHQCEGMERLILPCGANGRIEHLLVHLREVQSPRGDVCYELL